MIRTASLVLATISTGLTAGVFLLYAHTIMPGLRATDDRTFVAAFQSIDRSIINPWFLAGGFFGAVALTALAAALHHRSSAAPWILAALVLHSLVVVITMAVHLPLNDALKAAGSPDAIDVTAARQAFHETRWVAWNVVRVVLDLSAFAVLTVSLVLHGRDTPDPGPRALEPVAVQSARATVR